MSSTVRPSISSSSYGYGRVLERTQGNKSETARLLGISRSRLQRYVDKFKL